MIKITTLFLGIILFWNNSYSQIRINEVCSSNKGVLYDEDSDTPDWIELYNNSDEPVNLKNWKISDQSEFDSAWQLPDTTIEPRGYFLICASGKNRNSETIRLSTNGEGTNYNLFEDKYSWAYLELEGSNKFKVNYDSFKAEFIPQKKISKAGIVIKEKNEPISRMFSFFNMSDEGRQLFIQSRNVEKEYRGVRQLKDRIKIDENSQEVEIKNDSIYFRIIDNSNYIIKEIAYDFPLKKKYYIGFTILTYDTTVFDTLNIKSIYLNDKKLKESDFRLKSFHNTEISFYSENFFHTGFKLNNISDSLYLYNNDEIIEKIELPTLINDVSYSDDKGSSVFYQNPTPGYENSISRTEISNTDIINDSILFYDDKSEFLFLDSNFYFTTDYKTPDKDSKRLNRFSNIGSELLTLKKIENNKIESETLRIPRLDKESILNDELHFHIYTDSLNLFDEENGIITNTFSDAKVDAYLAITKGDIGLYSGNVDLRKHGNFSNIGRLQSSLRILFNKNEFTKKLKSELFPLQAESNGKSLILRNGGNDLKTMLRNRFSMISAKGLNLDWNEHNNAVVYLNNDFWGIYNLRERLDDDYLADKYNVDKDSINAFENEFNLKFGSPKAMQNLNKFLLSDDKKNAYSVIDSVVDIDNFIDYIFLSTFNINHDWPHNNVVAYSTGEKWKFLVTDLDYSYKLKGAGASVNYINEIFNNDEHITTRLLNELLKHKEFTDKYINRVCDLMNTSFSADSLGAKFSNLKDEFSKFVEIQNQRWPNTLTNWEEDTYVIERFVSRRSRFYYKYLKEYFNDQSAYLEISTLPINAGTYRVNSLAIDTSNWSGNYLQKVPVTITANSKHGFKFKKWNIDSLGKDSTISILLSDTNYIEAIYEKIDLFDKDMYIVINEIMYNAAEEKDTKDWIELYNAGKEGVNLNGWSIIDEDSTHIPFVIDNDYVINPDEYIIITKSKDDFEENISIENRIFSDIDFGFGGNDIVLLKDSFDIIQDSVNYDNDLPWPEGAEGTGFTIELTDPLLDNNEGKNWKISKSILGTAGYVNSVYDSPISNIIEIESSDEFRMYLVNNTLKVLSNKEIELFIITDLQGKKYDVDYTIRIKSIESDLSSLPNGLYLCNVTNSNGKTQTFKLILK